MSSEYYEGLKQEELRDACHHKFENISKSHHNRHKCTECGVSIPSEWATWYETGKKHGSERVNGGEHRARF